MVFFKINILRPKVKFVVHPIFGGNYNICFGHGIDRGIFKLRKGVIMALFFVMDNLLAQLWRNILKVKNLTN